jgi:hypothetical protein
MTEHDFVVVLARTEQHAGNPSVHVDAPLVLVFHKGTKPTAEFELFSGGIVMRPKFGDYAGRTLTLIQHHSVLHLTEDGDMAPGFGPFEVERFERRGD